MCYYTFLNEKLLQRYYFFLIYANNSEDFHNFTPNFLEISLRTFWKYHSELLEISLRRYNFV